MKKHWKLWLVLVIVLTIGFVGGSYFSTHKINKISFSLKDILLWPLNDIPEKNPQTLNSIFPKKTESVGPYQSKYDYEQKIIQTVKATDESVVSIIASKYVQTNASTFNPFNQGFDPFNLYFDIPSPQSVTPKYEKKEVSSGSGFIITENGYIITNKHVVSDTKAEYTVYLNSGKKYKGTVIAVDPLEDAALVKIEENNLKPLILGNSDELQLGQSLIAIGNALGEFQNTVSVGIVSGLNRSIVAGGGNLPTEKLSNLIQTDAAINPGNSGGPLLNLNGEVIGINTAIVASAQNIGFAIPINKIKNTMEHAVATGKITVPFIGVYYIQLDATEAETRKLDVSYGALISKTSKGEAAILKDSPAERASLKEGDIILSVNGEKITSKNTLSTVARKYNPKDTILLEVKRVKETLKIYLTLGSK